MNLKNSTTFGWPKILALIAPLVSHSSCSVGHQTGTIAKAQIPNLKGSAVPDSNGVALDCNGNIAKDLAEIGKPSSIYYEAWTDSIPPLSIRPCNDLRAKVFIAAHPHPDYATSNLARLTVIRTDSVLEKKGAKVGKGTRCRSLDRIWMNHRGWSTPVNIRICPSPHIGAISKTNSVAANDPRKHHNCRTFVIPPINDLGDSYQQDAILPGLLPAPNRSSDVPKIIFRVTHDSWNDRALVLDKVGVIIRILNPDYEMREIVATEISETAEMFGGTRGREMVDAFQPIAYKVDVLRLLFLKAIGGVYLDSKVFPQRPLDTILPENGGFLPWDIHKTGIWNGIMALPKGDPVSKIALDMIEKNIENRFYGKSSLAITGPILVEKALNEAVRQWKSNYDNLRMGRNINAGNSPSNAPGISGNLSKHDGLYPYSTYGILDEFGIFIYTDDTKNHSQYGIALNPSVPIFNIHNVEYRRRMTSDNHCHYSKLWNAHAVYYEAYCDPHSGLPSTFFSTLWRWELQIFAIVCIISCVAICLIALIICNINRRRRM
jgi:hypothetical protein